MIEGWADKPDQYTDEIISSHPLVTGNHESYNIAIEMVNNRHKKYEIIDLVNWLLVKNKADIVELVEALRLARTMLYGHKLDAIDAVLNKYN